MSSLLALCSNVAKAQSINIQVQLGPVSTITLSSVPNQNQLWRAKESQTQSPDDFVRLTHPTDVTLTAINLPPGWSFVTGTGVATFVFTGTDGANPNERFDLEPPLNLSFRTEGNDQNAVSPSPMTLRAELTVQLQDSGQEIDGNPIQGPLSVPFSTQPTQPPFSTNFTGGSPSVMNFTGVEVNGQIWRARETTSSALADFIRLVHAADIEVRAPELPAGWAFVTGTQDGQKTATWFFAGTDAQNTNERYDFLTPLQLTFQALRDGATTQLAALTLETNLTVLFTGPNQEVDAPAAGGPVQVPFVNRPLADFRVAAGLSPDGEQDAMDQSGNGVRNLLYYAFDLGNPTVSAVDRNKLPQSEMDAGNLKLTYTRRKNPTAAGLIYLVETSSSLAAGPWTPNLTLVRPPQVQSLNADFEQVTLTFPSTANQLYHRVGVRTTEP